MAFQLSLELFDVSMICLEENVAAFFPTEFVAMPLGEGYTVDGRGGEFAASYPSRSLTRSTEHRRSTD